MCKRYMRSSCMPRSWPAASRPKLVSVDGAAVDGAEGPGRMQDATSVAAATIQSTASEDGRSLTAPLPFRVIDDSRQG